ncbi:hypothetical protein AX284_01760 [Pseudomonas sp. HUK17]|nr:hypothetical protein AX284_01760 [Pseudomonas sp. HUK17]
MFCWLFYIIFKIPRITIRLSSVLNLFYWLLIATIVISGTLHQSIKVILFFYDVLYGLYRLFRCRSYLAINLFWSFNLHAYRGLLSDVIRLH